MAIRKYTGGDRAFLKACQLVGVAATHRQGIKWSKGKGQAREKWDRMTPEEQREALKRD